MTLTDDQRDDILSLAKRTAPWMMRLRRQLHQIPEPAFAEHQAAALVAGELAGLGLAVRNAVGGPGFGDRYRNRLHGRGNRIHLSITTSFYPR